MLFSSCFWGSAEQFFWSGLVWAISRALSGFLGTQIADWLVAGLFLTASHMCLAVGQVSTGLPQFSIQFFIFQKVKLSFLFKDPNRNSRSLVKNAWILLPKALAKVSHVTKTDSGGREVTSISWWEDMHLHITEGWLKRGVFDFFYNILYKDTTIGLLPFCLLNLREKIIQCC